MISHSEGPKSTAKEICLLAEFLKETVYIEKSIDTTGLGDTEQSHKITELLMLEKIFKVESNH